MATPLGLCTALAASIARPLGADLWVVLMGLLVGFVVLSALAKRVKPFAGVAKAAR
ncbi:hypothetical protein [Arthrobacter celericrescens]|uniref:hypothetical protein n=1 Tax=Arthrobacter celericrescens TaxID=2320851 RepID=UPI0013C4B462|nr:hypothetical protein [Arthrobacter celericrescens]